MTGSTMLETMSLIAVVSLALSLGGMAASAAMLLIADDACPHAGRLRRLLLLSTVVTAIVVLEIHAIRRFARSIEAETTKHERIMR